MTKSGESTSIVSICFLVLLLVTEGHALRFEYMANSCGETLDIGNEGGALDSQLGTLTENDLDCTITFYATIGRKILLTFDSMDIKGDPLDCESSDYLEVFDGTTKATSLGVFCGSTTPSAITSTSNSITLTLKTDSFDTGSGYQLSYTSFTESSDAACLLDEVECKNGRCIVSSLMWNDYDNCGDNSDEDSDANQAVNDYGFSLLRWGIGVLVGTIIGIIVGVVIICVSCGCMCYRCCCKKRQQPQHIGITQTGGPPIYNQQPPMAMQPTGQYGPPAGQPQYGPPAGQPQYGQPAQMDGSCSP